MSILRASLTLSDIYWLCRLRTVLLNAPYNSFWRRSRILYWRDWGASSEAFIFFFKIISPVSSFASKKQLYLSSSISNYLPATFTRALDTRFASLKTSPSVYIFYSSFCIFRLLASRRFYIVADSYSLTFKRS